MINLRAIECLPKVAPSVGFNLVRGSVPPVLSARDPGAAGSAAATTEALQGCAAPC